MVKVVKISNYFQKSLNSRDSESPDSCPVASASPSSTPPTFLFKKIFYLFWLCLSLLPHGLFSSCWERGLLSSCSAQASHCSGFSGGGAQALGRAGFSSFSSWALEPRLNSCGPQPWLLHSMWDLPESGMEPCIGRQTPPLSLQRSPLD